MSRATGWSCDVCQQFATSEDDRNPPLGWLMVNVVADPKLAGGAKANDHKHLCSSVCLKKWADARIKAERELREEPKEKPEPPPEVKAPVTSQSAPRRLDEGRLKTLRLQHINGDHKNFVNPECDLCDLDTRG